MSLHRIRRGLALLAAVLIPGGVLAAQIGTLTTVPGTVNDLAVDSSGDLLYCTDQGSVGTITTAGVVTELANSVTGPFSNSLRGVVENGSGEIAVLDSGGDIYELTGGLTPANLIYDDLYMIGGTTDFIVDTNGNYVIASRTPSSGVRGINWVNSNGNRWAYFLVKFSPVALAADPIGTGLVMADDSGSGLLHRIETGDASHPTTLMDGVTSFGFSENDFDGDIALETDGSAWIVGDGEVYRHDRGTGLTSAQATGLAQLRGVTIAASSGGVPSPSGWSLYLAEGSFPTAIREIGNVGAPASTVAGDLGTVPNRGNQLLFFTGQTVHDMAVDLNGDLLVGGDVFGASFKVMRVSLPSLAISTIANQADGISARIEGIQVDRDGVIYALGANGKIFRIVESPFSVTTVFEDTSNDITVGKDLAIDRDGSFYVADRASFGSGAVQWIDPNGVLTTLSNTIESRGVIADPFTANIIASEWNGTGFEGTIGLVDTTTGVITDFPNLSQLNYSNDSIWGDGDIVQDVEGNIYTISEDDWSLYRYDRNAQKKFRIGSSYLNNPSGLAIAKSTNPVGGQTGWSLYVAEYNFLYEFENVPAPAPRLLDRAAPPVGPIVGFLPGTAGIARAVAPRVGANELLTTTSDSKLFRTNMATGATIQVAGPIKGLAGDLVDIDMTPAGHALIANRGGTIFRVNPATGYTVSTIFTDPGGDLNDVRAIAFDGQADVLILDRPPGEVGGRLFRLSAGVLEFLCHTNRGQGMAIDPLTGDVFITERGSAIDGGGGILRVDTFQSPATAGHYSGDSFYLFDIGEFDGDIAFDDVGNFYVSTQNNGRIVRVDRATGTRSVVAGNYENQAALTLGPGRPGKTGPLGTSLFVLDQGSLFEVAVDELPATPPASPPALAPPVDLAVAGQIVPGATIFVSIDAPSEAFRPYIIFPSTQGKVPGFPMALFGDLSDTRILPNNFDLPVWNLIDVGAIFPGFFGTLDATGKTTGTVGLKVPNDPSLLLLDVFVDLTWISYDFVSPNGIAQVGGTAQIYIGE